MKRLGEALDFDRCASLRGWGGPRSWGSSSTQTAPAKGLKSSRRENSVDHLIFAASNESRDDRPVGSGEIKVEQL
jgi:hypothetical protein